MNKTISCIFFAILLLFSLPEAGSAASFQKPLPPLKINIQPVQSELTSAGIQPGDIVEFKITAISSAEAEQMHIDVDLLGGAKLVSGKTSWKGPAVKNMGKTLLLTVQAPKKGTGSIRARVWLPPSGTTRFSSEARFLLGPDTSAKTKQKPLITKDGKGRKIIEYR